MPHEPSKSGIVLDQSYPFDFSPPEFTHSGPPQQTAVPKFQLTDAVRPGPCCPVYPVEGYRREIWKGPRGERVPLLAISVSREKILDLFLDLLEPLGSSVDIILESSHGPDGNPTPSGRSGRDLTRRNMDRPIFSSNCLDFEDLLLNDGCTGISVISSRARNKGLIREVQLDEHKTLIVYSEKLVSFLRVLKTHGLHRIDSMKLLLEGDHLHRSSSRHLEEFERFSMLMGADGPQEAASF